MRSLMAPSDVVRHIMKRITRDKIVYFPLADSILQNLANAYSHNPSWTRGSLYDLGAGFSAASFEHRLNAHVAISKGELIVREKGSDIWRPWFMLTIHLEQLRINNDHHRIEYLKQHRAKGLYSTRLCNCGSSLKGESRISCRSCTMKLYHWHKNKTEQAEVNRLTNKLKKVLKDEIKRTT